MELNERRYLGDGLYVEFDGWQVRLFAHNGVRTVGEVFLEPEVLVSFLRWLEELKAFPMTPPQPPGRT